MKPLQIGHLEIGEKRPCLVVAEIGVNHNGSVELAANMIRAAAECGAHAVKFQRRTIDAILTRAAQDQPYDNERSYGPTYGTHRRALELMDYAWPALKKVAEECRVLFFATPYDPESCEFLTRLGVPAVKIASCDLTNPPLIDAACKMAVPVLMSTGMATEEEIDRAIRQVWEHTHDLVLMHCVSEYPAEAEDLNLRYLCKLRKRYLTLTGWSGHERGIQTSIAAVVLGSVVIERHFTLDRTLKGPDHAASLEPEGLKRLCRDIQRVEAALVERPKRMTAGEKKVRERLAKSLVAARRIDEGEVLERSALTAKGPGIGLAPYRIDEVIGKRALVTIRQDDLIGLEMLQ